ncbi:hypothetical protein KCU67_g13388, partial [Aureobasidium melanogenum]
MHPQGLPPLHRDYSSDWENYVPRSPSPSDILDAQAFARLQAGSRDPHLRPGYTRPSAGTAIANPTPNSSVLQKTGANTLAMSHLESQHQRGQQVMVSNSQLVMQQQQQLHLARQRQMMAVQRAQQQQQQRQIDGMGMGMGMGMNGHPSMSPQQFAQLPANPAFQNAQMGTPSPRTMMQMREFQADLKATRAQNYVQQQQQTPYPQGPQAPVRRRGRKDLRLSSTYMKNQVTQDPRMEQTFVSTQKQQHPQWTVDNPGQASPQPQMAQTQQSQTYTAEEQRQITNLARNMTTSV